ncbi:hypothetical protein [Winogradskyella psychrotolerans]|uniref:hypothetical protein n=1 Tax=Winogradskyella psychrotolerans TaxID=1344585 RepID=UPI001C068374|nr:hypothetical protein [Winogradskyella psychrotolerans]MBU2928067.1 hypothetical protein [Winogradskyella psychrotolerans]
MYLDKPSTEESKHKKKRKGLKDFFDFRNNVINQVGLIFFSAFVLATIITHQYNFSFDADLWKIAPGKRYKLSEILIDSEICIGKTGEDIKLLLGQPADYDPEQNVFFSYYLGNRPTFSGGEDAYLILHFKNGKVTKVTEEVH